MVSRAHVLHVSENNLQSLLLGKKFQQKVPAEWKLKLGDILNWVSGELKGTAWVVSSVIAGEELDCSFMKIS